MLGFRSEAEVREWCDRNGMAMNPLLSLGQQWQLATRWYANRLTVESRRPRPEEMKGIFAEIGLAGPFWDPAADRF